MEGDLILKLLTFCVDLGRNDVDQRHQDRKDIDGKTVDLEDGVRLAEIM